MKSIIEGTPIAFHGFPGIEKNPILQGIVKKFNLVPYESEKHKNVFKYIVFGYGAMAIYRTNVDGTEEFIRIHGCDYDEKSTDYWDVSDFILAGTGMQGVAFTVCFTGFADDEKKELKEKACEYGLKPMSTVAESLNLLIAGSTAGPKKLRLAKKYGIKIISKENFFEIAPTGIIIDNIGPTPKPKEAVELHDKLHLPPGIFVAIDFETADYKQDSACALGLVRVEDGKVVAEENRLIRPPREKVRNTRIHGLDWECLQNEPDFAQVWHEVSGLLDGAEYLIAHNAVFDRIVMEASCAAHSLPPAKMPFLCTLRGAKAAILTSSYRLSDLCERLSIPFGQHHRALSDAKAALKLLERLHESGISFDVMHVSAAAQPKITAAKKRKASSEKDAIKEFSALTKALICDDILNQKEFEFLCEWLTRHDHLAESPVVKPIFELAASILEDGIITQEELNEMKLLLATHSK